MGFSQEHVELIKTTRNYLKESGVPIEKYTFVNYGDSDLWICTYIEWDFYFTTEIKNKFVELGIKYDPRPRVINNN
jgi:hypothetical protein